MLPRTRIRKTLPILLAVIAVVGFAWTTVSACINLYGINIYVEKIDLPYRSAKDALNHMFTSHDIPRLKVDRERLAIELRSNPEDYKKKTDYAVTLMILGEPKKSIEILLEVEASNPGEYPTATNLGTAYELVGNNEKALEWIKEGYRRNANSHHKSEWLHVKILEAKMALARDPKWLETHSILGLDFGDESKPKLPARGVVDHLGEEQSPHQAFMALGHQLRERTAFVKAPDPIVADLLTDFAYLQAFFGTVDVGAEVLNRALEYQPTRREQLERRKIWMSQFLGSYVQMPILNNVVPAWVFPAAIGSFVLAGALIALLVRRWRARYLAR